MSIQGLSPPVSCALGRLVNEGFCEDLARQNIAGHLSQLQLGSGVVTYGLRTITYGVRVVTYGVRVITYGVRVVTCGVRVVTYGVRVVTYGVQSSCSVLKATI